MNGTSLTADTLLSDYLDSQNSAEEARLLERLAAEIRQIVRRVLLLRYGGDARDRDLLEDSCQDCLLSIFAKIDKLKRNTGEPPVTSLSAYAAATAQNAYRGEIRQRNPERYRLHQRLLQVIRENPQELAVWMVNGITVCGLREWEGRAPATPAGAAGADADGGLSSVDLPARITEAPLQQGLVELFRYVDTPLEVNALVGRLAAVQANPRPAFAGHLSSQLEDSTEGSLLEQLPDVKENVEEHAVESMHRESLLRRAWEEIQQLPARQRMALLYSLPPEAFMAYRLLVGPAALCECLEINRSQLDGLPARLPISDADIASEMGLKRQQVINLRLSARQRLSRRIPDRE